jgi:hypothetical protein
LDILLEASKYLRPQPGHGRGCCSLGGGAAFVNLQTVEAHQVWDYPLYGL